MSDTIHKFDEALRLRDQGFLAEARGILSQLCKTAGVTAAMFAVLGDVLWELDCLSDAIHAFRRAFELSPRSDVASFGLFHTLFQAGRNDDAFGEMRRFLSIADSTEYETLLSEIQSAK